MSPGSIVWNAEGDGGPCGDAVNPVSGLFVAGSLLSGGSCLIQKAHWTLCINAVNSGVGIKATDTSVISISGSALSRIFLVGGWPEPLPAPFSPAQDGGVKALA